jgi:hypothetical protein
VRYEYASRAENIKPYICSVIQLDSLGFAVFFEAGNDFRHLDLVWERLKKCCSHSKTERAVFLVSGFVSAQLRGSSNLLLRRSLAKNPRSESATVFF